jgi:phytoene synthase
MGMHLPGKDKEAAITAGFKSARAITRKEAKSFYFASRFLPKDKRYATYAIYAICKASDASVDSNEGIARNKNLEKIEKDIACVYNGTEVSNPLLLAFRKTVEKCKVPKQYFDELIKGMRMDLNKTRYENFDELYGYCYKVAAVIGLIMLKVFGCEDLKAEKAAVDLGIALQLTNILRDIKEDYLRGRIYLPRDEMASFGVSEEDVSCARLTPQFVSLMKFQIKRSRDYYAKSKSGIRLIPGLRSRLVACMIREVYSGILGAIEKANFDVFSRRAYVGSREKIAIGLKTLARGQFL